MSEESSGASAMARARWAKATPEEKAAHALKMNTARWAKVKKGKKQAKKRR